MNQITGPAEFSCVRAVEGSSSRWQLVEDGWVDDEEGAVENVRRWTGDGGIEVVTISAIGREVEEFCRDVMGRMLVEYAFSAGADKTELRRLARHARAAVVVTDEDQLVVEGDTGRGLLASADGLTARAASLAGAQYVVVYPGSTSEASRLRVRVG